MRKITRILFIILFLLIPFSLFAEETEDPFLSNDFGFSEEETSTNEEEELQDLLDNLTESVNNSTHTNTPTPSVDPSVTANNTANNSVQTYQLLAPIGSLTQMSSFSDYINALLMFMMGAGTGLAVLMVAVGGIQMIFAAGRPSAIGAGKERITNAIYGLILLALSALILSVINPNLLNISLV